MDTISHSGYYAGYPNPNFSKLSQALNNPYYTNFSTQVQNSNEDDIPALSPSPHYPASSHQSVCDGDLRSPMTPMESPRLKNGDRASNARTSAPREDAHVFILHDDMDESLLLPFTEIHNPVPKFTRTVSDAVEDELFRSNMDSPRPQHNGKREDSAMSPTLATYFQKAQKDHVSEARSVAPNPFATRDRSPFRANSPFHSMRTQTTPVRQKFLGNMTAQGKREQQQELELQSINDQMIISEAQQLASTPKTISPKDAVLEYPEPEDEASKMSLFAHEQQGNSYGIGGGNDNGHIHSGAHSHYHGSDDEQGSYTGESRRGSEAESIGTYSYHHSPQLSMMTPGFPYPIHTLGSSEMSNTTMSESHTQPQSSPALSKPEGSRADTGAYTCTASGCQQRFPTSAKLQKHKRENHRQSTPIGAAGMTSTLHGGLNRLQGPHRCARINPTTGKPCNTIFSRPYDLTRHEDTIHNTSREKVRCEICNDEKTFSRQDALTRHKKVKHGIDK